MIVKKLVAGLVMCFIFLVGATQTVSADPEGTVGTVTSVNSEHSHVTLPPQSKALEKKPVVW